MRVAILGPYPTDSGTINGGVEAVVTYLVDELAHLAGIELHVITSSTQVLSAHLSKQDGIAIHRLPQQRRLAGITFNRLDVQRLRRKLVELSPDVVHAQGSTLYAGAAVGSPYPHLVTVHGIAARDESILPGLRNRLRASLVAYYERQCVRKATNLISISPYVQREFGHVIGGRIYPLENPIHPKFYRLTPREVPKTLLFTGRLIPRKAVHHLLRAVSIVKRTQPCVELRIAGETRSDPAYFAALQHYVDANDLRHNVRFLGPLDEDGILQESSRCSIVVLASRQETAPMAIQQAMAAAKPVVATRICGVPYLVEHQITGLLVDYGDVQGLATAVLELLANEDERIEMGIRAREAAQRFRADVVARATRDIYAEVSRTWARN